MQIRVVGALTAHVSDQSDRYAPTCILHVSGFCPNGHSLAAIDEKGARGPREMAARDHLQSDGASSIGRRCGDRIKDSTAISSLN
jgi:hypothetical protein